MAELHRVDITTDPNNINVEDVKMANDAVSRASDPAIRLPAGAIIPDDLSLEQVSLISSQITRMVQETP